MTYIKKLILSNLLSKLHCVKTDENDNYCFLVREINSQENKTIIESYLEDLTKIFKLPSPSRRNKIKKFTSSLIVHMAKECQCDIEKSTKYFRAGVGELDDATTIDSGYESTSGFYHFKNM